MPIIKAPEAVDFSSSISVFLAGSIEMGSASPWQETLQEAILGWDESVTVLNPRRDDWDSTWDQSISNPNFLEQVQWEQRGLYEADIVFFHFDPDTKSPVTLMELGQVLANRTNAAARSVVIVCPRGFWRRGNVEIVAMNHRVRVLDSLEDGKIALEFLLRCAHPS